MNKEQYLLEIEKIWNDSKDAPSGKEIIEVCVGITQLLLSKNISYGNSALNPTRIFSKSSPEEQILVRIDDKLSRISRGSEYPGDDTLEDLIGYLTLLLVSRRQNANV